MDDGLVYKTHATEQAVPSDTGEAWNRWIEAHFEAYSAVQTEAIGQALAEERQLHRRETEKALAPLQRELAELRGQVAVLLSLLGGAKAAVISLPSRELSAS